MTEPYWEPLAAAPLPPVVNGQWIKGVGGAAVWAPIAPADITGVGVVREVGTAGLKAQWVPQTTLSFPANDGSGNSSAVLTLPVAWPNSHFGFAVGYIWPFGHWNFYVKVISADALNRVTLMFNQAGGAQTMTVSGVSFGN